MKRMVMAALCMIFCLVSLAGADELGVYETTVQVHPSIPAFTIRVSGSGEVDENQPHPLRLRADIVAEDGSIVQTLYY